MSDDPHSGVLPLHSDDDERLVPSQAQQPQPPATRTEPVDAAAFASSLAKDLLRQYNENTVAQLSALGPVFAAGLAEALRVHAPAESMRDSLSRAAQIPLPSTPESQLAINVRARDEASSIFFPCGKREAFYPDAAQHFIATRHGTLDIDSLGTYATDPSMLIALARMSNHAAHDAQTVSLCDLFVRALRQHKLNPETVFLSPQPAILSTDTSVYADFERNLRRTGVTTHRSDAIRLSAGQLFAPDFEGDITVPPSCIIPERSDVAAVTTFYRFNHMSTFENNMQALHDPAFVRSKPRTRSVLLARGADRRMSAHMRALYLMCIRLATDARSMAAINLMLNAQDDDGSVAIYNWLTVALLDNPVQFAERFTPAVAAYRQPLLHGQVGTDQTSHVGAEQTFLFGFNASAAHRPSRTISGGESHPPMSGGEDLRLPVFDAQGVQNGVVNVQQIRDAFLGVHQSVTQLTARVDALDSSTRSSPAFGDLSAAIQDLTTTLQRASSRLRPTQQRAVQPPTIHRGAAPYGPRGDWHGQQRAYGAHHPRRQHAVSAQ